MEFVLECPIGRDAERAYVSRVLLEELLGLTCSLAPNPRGIWRLRTADDHDGVTIADAFLGMPASQWLTPGSVPASTIPWSVPGEYRGFGLPATLPLIGGAIETRGDLTLNADLFGTAFFLLTRYEEFAAPWPDQQGRHRPEGMLSFREGWVDRPVVNEIAEVLWAAIQRRWPGVERVSREFRVLVSHDADHPRCVVGKSALRLMAGAARIAMLEGWESGRRRFTEWSRVRRGGLRADPCWTFEWLMDQSERRGLQSAFYFIPGAAGGSEYDLADPALAAVLRQIRERGHEIGFHPSRSVTTAPDSFRLELADLRTALVAAGAADAPLGGRHHYLRWQADGSWDAWEAAGLAYDSSLGFEGTPGFRAGICVEYPTFDLRHGRPLALRERPLMVMDTTLLAKPLLGLPHEVAVRVALDIASTCRRYQGDFVLLWHNCRLRTAADREAYLAVLDGCRNS